MESPVSNKAELLKRLSINRDAPPEPSRSRTPIIVTAIVCTLLGSVVGHWFAPQTDTSQVEPNDAGRSSAQTQKDQADVGVAETAASSSSSTEPNPSRTSTIASDSQSILNASGYITARRMATVSAEVMGLIKSVDVEEGMQVTSGQVLASLDETLASINLDFAKAQIKALQARQLSADATLKEAARNLQRISENRYSSQADLTAAQTQLDTAKAALASANADIVVANIEVERQQERLNDHTIRAPFDGVVTMKNAQPGEIVAPTSAGGGFTRTGICTIVDMDSQEIEVDVNESYIGRVSQGQPVEARLDAYPEWTIPASVIAVIPTADRAKATVKVRIKIETKDERILPDMGVKVAFMKKA